MKIRSIVLSLFLLTTLLLSQCKKNTKSTTPGSGSSLPTVSTLFVHDIHDSTAYASANVSASGSSSITRVGICYAINPNPTIDQQTNGFNSVGTGTFNLTMGPLNANTTYYVRAFATNANGTAYGDQITFKTLAPFIRLTSNLPNSGVSCTALLTQGSTV